MCQSFRCGHEIQLEDNQSQDKKAYKKTAETPPESNKSAEHISLLTRPGLFASPFVLSLSKHSPSTSLS